MDDSTELRGKSPEATCDALEGAALDEAVAKAEGYSKVVRTRTNRISYEDGWGRTTLSMPPQWETTSEEEWTQHPDKPDVYGQSAPMPFSTSWALGGPIIEREGFRLERFGPEGPDRWSAHTQLRPVKNDWEAPSYCAFGPTALIAAMRAYVASKARS